MSVDDLEVTATVRVFMEVLWRDARIIYTSNNTDEPFAIMVTI